MGEARTISRLPPAADIPPAYRPAGCTCRRPWYGSIHRPDSPLSSSGTHSRYERYARLRKHPPHTPGAIAAVFPLGRGLRLRIRIFMLMPPCRPGMPAPVRDGPGSRPQHSRRRQRWSVPAHTVRSSPPALYRLDRALHRTGRGLCRSSQQIRLGKRIVSAIERIGPGPAWS